jgi:2',3'-cyclic-nucleotide 2'-phosphodiesterase (5'-nucleotidase family)
MKHFIFILTALTLIFTVVACDDDTPTTEILCNDDLDNDNDGFIDCHDPDCVGDEGCVAVEICDNGIDDDGDGDIDCDDTDCSASCSSYIKHITIIGTADLHSHIMGRGAALDYTPMQLGDDNVTGGLARIASVINGVRDAKDASGIPTLLVDSGGFLVGDMVDLFATTSHPLFNFFQLMEYDAVTLGNSEFHWGVAGTEAILNAAIDNIYFTFEIPLLSSNIQTSQVSEEDDGIEILIDDGVILPYIIKIIDDDFAVGIFGMMGIEAHSNIPQADPITWWNDDPYETDGEFGYEQTQELIDEIKAAGAHLLVHASHMGINSSGLGEDCDMAFGTTGIDVIFSGYKQELLENEEHYVKVSDTHIIAAGAYGEYVDQLDIIYNLNLSAIEEVKATLHTIDDTILGDSQITEVMDMYISMLDENTLEPELGVTYSETPLAHTNFDLSTGNIYQPIESLLVADAVREVINNIISEAVNDGVVSVDPSFDASPIEVSFSMTGSVQSPLYSSIDGFVTAADLYKIAFMGVDSQMVTGHPMMSFYITPAELKIILNLNVEAMYNNAPIEYQYNISGVRGIYDGSGTQFNRVVAAYDCSNDDPFTLNTCLTPQGSMQIDLNDATSLIRVTADYYGTLLLPQMRNSLGQDMVIDPKDKDGTIIDMTDSAQVAAMIFNATPGDSNSDGSVNEQDHSDLKIWVALIKFVAGFSDDWIDDGLNYMEATDSVPSFPKRVYSEDNAPVGQEDEWQMGLHRIMSLNKLCVMPGMDGVHTLCP